MDNRWISREWVSRVLLACALSMFLFTEAVLIVAALGWPNSHVPLGTREIGHLLVSAFLTIIPLFVGIGGCNVVKRLQSKLEVGREEATFIWLWRQYLVGTVFAYGAIISVVIFLGGPFTRNNRAQFHSELMEWTHPGFCGKR